MRIVLKVESVSEVEGCEGVGNEEGGGRGGDILVPRLHLKLTNREKPKITRQYQTFLPLTHPNPSHRLTAHDKHNQI